MKGINIVSTRNIGIGLLALLATLPMIYAQQPQQPRRDERAPRAEPPPRGEPATRGAPARAQEERRPVVVDRVNHGTIRHVDTQTVQRPVEVRHETEGRQYATVHRDVEVDLDRSRFWHSFVFGQRIGALRAGYLRVLVNGMPYYYDDGIYYQQAGDDYQVVYPPVGASVQALPNGAIAIEAGNLDYYYAGGAFYTQQNGVFAIAAPPMGVTVPELPPGAVLVSAKGGVAYQFNGIYYRPVFVNGVTQFMTFMP